VRERAEFEVSHLSSAQHVQPSASASAVQLPKDQPIVTYCSVGYRSGGFAEKLRQAGYTNVSNLEGSIFRWSNEGRPVFRGGEEVQTVHPYNRTWGLLLKRPLRADL
jgi:rhodanese-related sulfurtransferase